MTEVTGPIGFREDGSDIAAKYISDFRLVWQYLTEEGRTKYGSYGDIYAWGDNSSGQLGFGFSNTTSVSTPVKIPSRFYTSLPWKDVSAGDTHSLAIDYNNTPFAWGDGSYGKLGDNSTSGSGVPDYIFFPGPIYTALQVSAGGQHSLAIGSDTSLWAWGNNDSGQIGIGFASNSALSPIQVGFDTYWHQISAGGRHSAGIISYDSGASGYLYTWGDNINGQLGLGDRTDRYFPNAVGFSSIWKKVTTGNNHTLAIKTDGTLWSWGRNFDGQLGLGDTTHRSSPVQVGSLTNWKQVSGGGEHTLAIKTNGTLWAWGSNTNGELGLGDTTHRSSPVQVGSLTNWSQVSAGGEHSLATKTDGTLWAWGQGGSGQLGLGDITHRSSPVQVGTLTNWSRVFAGGEYSLAIAF